MKSRFSFSKGKKHDSSMKMRSQPKKNVGKKQDEYPFLAEKTIEMSDIILEILDSRFIEETRNKELEDKILNKNKKIIYVFNKSDLIDDLSQKELEVSDLTPKLFISCAKRQGIRDLRNKIKISANFVKNRVDKRDKKITVGIIGYPNTGKSSIINLLIGKKTAGTGADAGFTKGIQKVKLTSNILLLDSPGVIPKKDYTNIESKKRSKQTKLGGRSYSQVKYPETVVCDLLKEYPGIIEKHYQIDSKGDSEILIEILGRKRGFLKKGGEVEEDKTARLILKDWQEGKIRLS
jgi:ribosome biogenesis GTPase A